MSRSIVPTVALALPLVAAPSASQTLIDSYAGNQHQEQAGRCVAIVPWKSLGQSYRVVAVGSPLHDVNGPSSGRVVFRDIATGAVLYTHNGLDAGDQCGTSVAGGGDLDGDGSPEVLIGAPWAEHAGQPVGAVYPLATDPFAGAPAPFVHGDEANSLFGWRVAILDDLDGDGKDEFLVTAPHRDRDLGLFGSYTDAGWVGVYDGETGALLRSHAGSGDGARLGYDADALGDVDGDGVGDYVIGEPGYDGGISDGKGRALVYSGATGSVLADRTVVGGGVGDALGRAVCRVDDANGDGVDDYAVAAPYDDVPAIFGITLVDAGNVQLFSGTDGSFLRAWFGGQSGGLLGFSIDGGGDVDGDGRGDLVAGEPWSGASDEGRARVWSGRTGATIYDVRGTDGEAELTGHAVALGDADGDARADFAVGRPFQDFFVFGGGVENQGGVDLYAGRVDWILEGLGEQLGDVVAALGDVDGDGWDDLAYGGAGLSGEFYFSGWEVRSGRTSAVIHADHSGSGGGGSLAGIEDVNGDGRADFLVGNPDVGLVEVRSGTNGAVLHTLAAGPADARFGAAVADAGDVTGDGVHDVIVGAPRHDASAQDVGAAYLFSGSTGILFRVYTGTHAGGQLGTSVAGLGSIDGDGYADYAIGEPGAPSSGVFAVGNSGRARVYSGRFGFESFDVYGLSLGGGQAGASVAGPGDVDGDGFDDVAVGEPRYDHGSDAEAGRVRVVSGATGLSLFDVVGEQAGMRLGAAVAAVGDVDHDGHADVAAAAPAYDVATFLGITHDQGGSVRVHSGADGGELERVNGFGDGQGFGHALAGRATAGVDGRNELVAGTPSNVGFVRLIELPRASSVPLGAGCGSPAHPSPYLTSTGPVLGDELELIVLGVPQGTFAFYYVAAPGLAPLPLAPGCEWQLDVLSQYFVGAAIAGPEDATFGLLLPDDPSKVGIRFAGQALVGLDGGAFAGAFGVTNGRLLTIGF